MILLLILVFGVLAVIGFFVLTVGTFGDSIEARLQKRAIDRGDFDRVTPIRPKD